MQEQEKQEKRVFTLYVNREDKTVEIPKQLVGTPMVIAVSPAYILEKKLSETGIKQIKEARDWGCVIGQRGGTSDSCKYHSEHDWRDRYHDTDSCPWHLFDYGSLREFLSLREGKQILEDTFGVKPLVYNPINHLFRKKTLENLQKLGFEFVMDRNQIGIPAYLINPMLMVLPEVKLPNEAYRKTSAMYADLETIQKPEVLEILSRYKLVLPSNIEPSEVSFLKREFNSRVKVARKRARDVYTAFK